jgi:hypothetical protein
MFCEYDFRCPLYCVETVILLFSASLRNLWISRNVDLTKRGPHETAPVDQHPPTPTMVYVYVTDGGVMRLARYRRACRWSQQRPQDGSGRPEAHSVEHLGDPAGPAVTVGPHRGEVEWRTRDRAYGNAHVQAPWLNLKPRFGLGLSVVVKENS